MNKDDMTARYDRLADSIEAGNYEVDDSSVEVRADYSVGRPRRDQVAAATQPIAVRLTEEDRARLAAYAERTGQPMSVVIRSAVAEWLDRHPAA